MVNLGLTAHGRNLLRSSFVGSTVFVQSSVAMFALVALVTMTAAAHAGPCTALIEEMERYISRSTRGPTAAQSIGAQLHHQPTPQSVEGAASKARADVEAALDRARKADAAGDAATCTKAVDEAKLIYGLE